ncbi:geranylgeranyl diphosphate synthase type II [Pseudomonas duriflava]|uniref:Geranylgeranyl diphosphate synthase type II n=1 Tax=Pseudomonas duriflava TaxID=459528 RepID=A0A562Q8D6_9PSED|nr:polyprenyl synthetase family protein [Pseudomonas duriflava]TWI53017.1 geranylgeranyl diphosphate synthase type II [Pseudomonas duriflava]
MATVLVPTPAKDSALELVKERARIDVRLEELLPPVESGDLVCAAMREGALAPGKRIRPLLMLLAARDLGHVTPAILDLGCAVEMVHAASLFLDDMPCMDNAQMRRGRPTIHVQYGEDVAVLGAVALLSHAFCVVASVPGVAPVLRTQMVCLLSGAVGSQGLVRGQYRDLREGQTAREAAAISSANQLKTGSLFTAALDMTALALSAKPAIREGMHHFAVELGQAFQLLDDLQDGQGIGKDAHKDHGKSTLVSLLGQDAVQAQLDCHLQAARQALQNIGLGSGGLGHLVDVLFDQ